MAKEPTPTVGVKPQDTVESQLRRAHDGPEIDITRFQQEISQDISGFLADNSSADNQPKTYQAWLKDFVKWVNG